MFTYYLSHQFTPNFKREICYAARHEMAIHTKLHSQTVMFGIYNTRCLLMDQPLHTCWDGNACCLSQLNRLITTSLHLSQGHHIHIKLLPASWHSDSHKSMFSMICCLTFWTASGELQFWALPVMEKGHKISDNYKYNTKWERTNLWVTGIISGHGWQKAITSINLSIRCHYFML